MTQMVNWLLHYFRLWQEVGYSVPEPLCSALLEDVVHNVEVIRKAAAPALAAAVTEHPDVAPSILQQLVDLYDAKLKVLIAWRCLNQLSVLVAIN